MGPGDAHIVNHGGSHAHPIERLAGFLGEDIGGQPSCGGADGAEGPELNVSFSFLVASGDVLGVRLATVDRTPNADGIDTRAYWYDGAAQKYRPSPGLIADDSRDAFVAALKERRTLLA